ncbi:MAG: GHKL domain-containing protein [Oscillospiraceae bacterium]|nr:GHKL domain-containing protein [Oscillospiraceae bacterium]
MNTLSIVLEVISDNIFLFASILFVDLLAEKNNYDQSISKRRVGIAVVLSSIVSILFKNNYTADHLLFINGALIVVNFLKYIFLISYINRNINLRYILITLIAQFISSVVTAVLPLFIAYEENYYIILTGCTLIVNSLLLTLVMLIRKKADQYTVHTIFKIIPTYIYTLILIMLFLLSGITNVLNYNTSNMDLKIAVIKFLVSLLIVCLIAVILSLIFNVVSEKYNSDINSMLKKQVNSQLCHYKQLEKLNTEIRSFRHDYINHMKCINSMLSNGEYEELEKYIGSLSSAFPAVTYLFETGNYIADAILTEKQLNAPDDISIEFEGIVPSFIDNIDLCTVLSNAIDNAVEACCLCSGEKTIRVYSGFKHGYFILKIKNPTVNDIEKSRLETTKDDTVNHGFGLFNIRKTVKKYDGHVSTSCTDNVFTLNIAFSENN